ncbi:pseudouridine synthase [Ideonella oryzae]|uniref:tRNA pseudouridine synthase C n=1 Tax=Ideonella oryzae TaxID=2937441 RepID=A0ABT1BJ68_9BURK|nr:pseudouridine synthase [Ideonella oryzae]MCO5975964.1 pseudouridine synthase [Ideonella oryzae]
MLPPILYRDEDLLVVHKPAGLLVHRTTLDWHEHDSVLDRLRQGLPVDEAAHLAPAHRLDKGTSGLLVFTRHAQAARRMGELFETGQVHKRYLALVRGWPAPEGSCEHPLARDPERPSQGQVLLPALTHFRRLARVEWPLGVDGRFPTARYALVEALPQTGRRHQIRRHFKHLAHPLIGDATHGKGPHNRAVAAWTGTTRLWLLAHHLSLPHPATGRPLTLHAAAEQEWGALLDRGNWAIDDEATLAGIMAPASPHRP